MCLIDDLKVWALRSQHAFLGHVTDDLVVVDIDLGLVADQGRAPNTIVISLGGAGLVRDALVI